MTVYSGEEGMRAHKEVIHRIMNWSNEAIAGKGDQHWAADFVTEYGKDGSCDLQTFHNNELLIISMGLVGSNREPSEVRWKYHTFRTFNLKRQTSS